jgi:hypothetical protein
MGQILSHEPFTAANSSRHHQRHSLTALTRLSHTLSRKEGEERAMSLAKPRRVPLTLVSKTVTGR